MPLGDILVHFSPFYGHIACYTPIKAVKTEFKISS